MSLITIPNVFSAGAVIIASQHNANFSTLASDYNGNIENVNISGTAAIEYSKLSLTGGIVNADINSAAGIVASKLVLTSPGAIGSVSPNTGAFTTLKVGTTNQGDILYDNGTIFERLAPGTSGQFLKTLGSSANPAWADIIYFSYNKPTLVTVISEDDTHNIVFPNTTPTKMMEVTMNVAGTYTVTWTGFSSDGSNPNRSQAYKNGSPIGSLHTASSGEGQKLMTESGVTVSINDKIQIYSYNDFSTGSGGMYVSNLNIAIAGSSFISNTSYGTFNLGTSATISNTGNMTYFGTGTPSNYLGIQGDIYIRTDGGATTTLYVKTGSLTWTAK